MLTGIGLIGKLVEFLATKLIGRKIDLALDDRKRACRAFTELYYCVDRLEEITSKFLTEIDLCLDAADDSSADGKAYWVINEFHNRSYSLEAVSRRFSEIGSEVGWAVEIFDPTLAEAVDQLYCFKYSFLYFISDSIEIKDQDGKNFQLLAYKEPSPKILKIDMDSYYDWVKQNQGKKIDRSAAEWPINFLRFSEFEEGFTDAVFGIEDIEAARQFRDVIKTHAGVLSEARKKLREFLTTNFNLEEVLYVSKELPPRDSF
jgi:hypothetical protein